MVPLVFGKCVSAERYMPKIDQIGLVVASSDRPLSQLGSILVHNNETQNGVVWWIDSMSVGSKVCYEFYLD